MNKFKNFFKRYGYYCVAGVLILGIITTVAIASGVNGNAGLDNKDPQEVSVVTYEFGLPMKELSVIKDYSDTDLMFNDTLGHYEAHMGIDFTSATKEVYSIFSGTVVSIENDYQKGTIITIKHGGGYESVYSSLEEETEVEKGQSVEKGQRIGTAGNTASASLDLGDHLHLEMFKDGKKVNPANYIQLSNK